MPATRGLVDKESSLLSSSSSSSWTSKLYGSFIPPTPSFVARDVAVEASVVLLLVLVAEGGGGGPKSLMTCSLNSRRYSSSPRRRIHVHSENSGGYVYSENGIR